MCSYALVGPDTIICSAAGAWVPDEAVHCKKNINTVAKKEPLEVVPTDETTTALQKQISECKRGRVLVRSAISDWLIISIAAVVVLLLVILSLLVYRSRRQRVQQRTPDTPIYAVSSIIGTKSTVASTYNHSQDRAYASNEYSSMEQVGLFL